MKSATLGYDLRPKYWGNGFITEVVHRIVKAALLGELPCCAGRLRPNNTGIRIVCLKLF
jgi:RimJ/RimL family protein N-acetyltransferase